MTEPHCPDTADRTPDDDFIQLRIVCNAGLHNLGQVLDMLDAQSRCAGFDAAVRHDLRLIAEEACVNVIRHAYQDDRDGRLSLTWESTQHLGRPAVRITLQDDGRPFEPAPVAVGRDDGDGPGEALSPGGWGVPLIQHLSDAYSYQRVPGGRNSLLLVKYVDAVPATSTSVGSNPTS